MPTKLPDLEIESDTVPSSRPDAFVPVGIHGLMAATQKALAMNRGLATQDHRDGIAFKRIMTTADLMAERVQRDSSQALRKVMGYAARHRSLKGVMPGALNDNVEGHLVGNPLSSPLEEINPLDVLNQAHRITLMGPGGISSADMVTTEMQAVHPSEFGFISPIEGPECTVGDAQVYTKNGWKLWTAASMDDEFACLVKGKHEWHKASRLVVEPYKGDMLVLESDKVRMCVTPTHRVVYTNRCKPSKWHSNAAENMYGNRLKVPVMCDASQIGKTPCAYEVVRTWSKIPHNGLVYCATVPGGMLLMRGSPDTLAFWTGNSEMAGIDSRLANGVKIGSNGRLYQRFEDPHTKDVHWLSPEDLYGKVVGLPEP